MFFLWQELRLYGTPDLYGHDCWHVLSQGLPPSSCMQPGLQVSDRTHSVRECLNYLSSRRRRFNRPSLMCVLDVCGHVCHGRASWECEWHRCVTCAGLEQFSPFSESAPPAVHCMGCATAWYGSNACVLVHDRGQVHGHCEVCVDLSVCIRVRCQKHIPSYARNDIQFRSRDDDLAFSLCSRCRASGVRVSFLTFPPSSLPMCVFPLFTLCSAAAK